MTIICLYKNSETSFFPQEERASVFVRTGRHCFTQTGRPSVVSVKTGRHTASLRKKPFFSLCKNRETHCFTPTEVTLMCLYSLLEQEDTLLHSDWTTNISLCKTRETHGITRIDGHCIVFMCLWKCGVCFLFLHCFISDHTAIKCFWTDHLRIPGFALIHSICSEPMTPFDVKSYKRQLPLFLSMLSLGLTPINPHLQNMSQLHYI